MESFGETMLTIQWLSDLISMWGSRCICAREDPLQKAEVVGY